jgi:acetyl esterase/lipase
MVMRVAPVITALMLTLLYFHSQPAIAQKETEKASPTPSSTASASCYDGSNDDEIRLWKGLAPGAIGNDPCRDIPFLRVYRATDPNRHGSAVLLIPGGGYDRLSDRKEQAPVAEYFSQKLKLTTFVLYYRLVQPDGDYRYPIPIWDGQRAFKLIRYHASDYGINPDRIGVFGFSAGGHLATMLALHSSSDFDLPQPDAIDAVNGRPDFLGLGYPVISMDPSEFAPTSSFSHLLFGYHGKELHSLEKYLSGQENVTRDTPPVFLFESMDDRRISPQNSVLFAQALKAQKVPAEIHLFSHGIHGAGLAKGIPEEQTWPELFHQWLLRQGFLP